MLGLRLFRALPVRASAAGVSTEAGRFAGSRRQSQRSASPMLKVYILAAITAIMLPFIYDIIVRAAVPDEDYAFRHELHIGLTSLATIGCLVAILSASGNFQDRLKAGLFSVCINFGILMLLTTWFRLYYSRPLLIAAFFAAIAIISTFNILIDRHKKRRIGIVPGSVDDESMQHIDKNAVLMVSPDEPSWAYDVVLIDWTRVRDPQWLQFATRAILSGCQVQHVSAYIEDRLGRVVSKHFDITHAASPRNSVYVLVYKRVLDISLVVLFSPLVLLLTAIAGGLVALTMGRPILYVQKRVGKDGRSFMMYKLRTMVAAKEGATAVATSVGDPRITPLGKMLRRFRIDELPQFYNIFKGDMSLVGPRPEQPELARSYADRWPQFRDRTILRPGITGWAQVRGTYAADAEESQHKLAFDLYYLKHASLMMDVSIMLQTFRSLLTGNSAR